MANTVADLTVDEAGRVFTDPTAYADDERFHAACALLRREAPVHRVEVEGFNPFWALTKHADVMEIERQHDKWLNAPRAILGPAISDAQQSQMGSVIRTLINMDAPDHPAMRAITSDWFLPKSLSRLDERIAELSKRYVDRMVDLGGECDFMTDVAVHYPLYVILSILGLPEEDFPLIMKLTQELFGASDPEMQRGATPEEAFKTIQEFFQYFQAVTEDRRANPTDDLASVIANSTLHGEPLSIFDAFGYYLIIATAGHDTTSSSIAGGMHALLEHPDQMERLRQDPSLVPTAVEEMIRWVSPVKQFMRTNLTSDYELRGQTIPKGEAVFLSYASANRDEEVFANADTFDVGRNPNKHVAFGFGAHFCLGAQLARMEGRAFYNELLPRLRSIELAGEPSYMQTLFVGGPKHLPIRYELA
ncbi:MAG TPA: cytochrome P450 [Acidimicrobiales bacterium]|nr:cytochrome P450 [Acidimicrobiales bacterium]